MRTKNQDNEINKRLRIFQLADELGSVKEACQRSGISRTQFYEYKRRYEHYGDDGLQNRSRAHHSYPNTITTETENLIVELSLKHPGWGCSNLSQELNKQGIHISRSLVQKILNRNYIGKKDQRWFLLENSYFKKGYQLTPEQEVFIEKINPAFREHLSGVTAPGDLVCQDTFFIGRLKSVGRIYLHAAIDVFSAYAFGLLSKTKNMDDAILLLKEHVLPAFHVQNLPIQNIMTDTGWEFCGKGIYTYEIILEWKNIKHHKIDRSSSMNGLLERFKGIVLDDFVEYLQDQDCEYLDTAQYCLNRWLSFYNNYMELPGYPYWNKPPVKSWNSNN